jgi:hypothetical protein
MRGIPIICAGLPALINKAFALFIWLTAALRPGHVLITMQFDHSFRCNTMSLRCGNLCLGSERKAIRQEHLVLKQQLGVGLLETSLNMSDREKAKVISPPS